MNDAPKRNWLWTCGCGAEAHMVNAKVVFTGEPCARCVEQAADESDHLVAAEAGWCGCGPSQTIDEAMLTYLTGGDGSILTADDTTSFLLAYLADDLGWTEHGGIVTAAWLTDAGREAIVNLTNARGDA